MFISIDCVNAGHNIPLISTKVAIKMGRATDKNKELQSKANETPSPISSDDEDEEMEMADEREETPDLYRNSSLGM